MNNIKKLQSDHDQFANQINNADFAIQDFKILLDSDKFKGPDNNYIQVNDVFNQLTIIRHKLLGID